MNDDALEEMAREILNGNMCEGIACPEHGFKFITMSDGDGHPASWHYFCDHESHEEEHELIDGKVWISKRIVEALRTLRSKTRKEDAEKLQVAVEALKRYGKHDGTICGFGHTEHEDGCRGNCQLNPPCTCGFEQALQAILKKEEEENG